MKSKIIFSIILVFFLGFLSGYVSMIILNPSLPQGIHLISGHLKEDAFPCSGDICPLVIVYVLESDEGQKYFLTREGNYCYSLDFNNSTFHVDDYVEITGIVYTKTVNQGLIYCLEYFDIDLK